MNILFLAPDFPLPTKSGLCVRVLSQLTLLSTIEQVSRIDLLSLSAEEISIERRRELEELVPKLHVALPVVRATSIRRSRKALLRFISRRISHCEPYLVAVNFTAELRNQIVTHLASRKYDVVYFGYLGMMSYVGLVRALAPSARVVLEQHNLEWQIFDRLARDLRPPLRQVVAFEAQALKSYEIRALKAVDAVIAISKLDAAEFKRLALVDAVAVPPFVAPKPIRSNSANSSRIGYIGHLAWQPNVFGLNWFCSEVWPIVRKRLPDAELVIAGPGLSVDASGALSVPSAWQAPGIRTVGFIEDLNPFYDSVSAAIAPVVGGSGVRMKLLETMSAGIPTVTTSDGASGLNVANRQNVLIANEPNAFADAVIQLLSDSKLRACIRQGGYEYLDNEHSAKIGILQLLRALDLDDARPR